MKNTKTHFNNKNKLSQSKKPKNQSFEKNIITSRRWNNQLEGDSVITSTVSVSSVSLKIMQRFRDRIEKACSTYTTADFKK